MTNPYQAGPRWKGTLAKGRADGPPRVLAHVHKYPPTHGAGAEWMLHAILRHLLEQGWQARVIADVEPGDFQGVELLGELSQTGQVAAHQWADVVITHLDETRRAIHRAAQVGRPLVHLVHNHRQLAHHRVRPHDAELVVFNSEWIASEHAKRSPRWPTDTMVCRPPVDGDAYRVQRLGHAATLVNLTESKGARLFYELAVALPQQQFLGVRGAYGEQIVPPAPPPNVAIIENQPDVRTVLEATRVLLMPSAYESWGRMAVEAMASGIPVLAHPTPGLLEALGDAAWFIDREDVHSWRAALLELRSEPQVWARWSRLALERSAELTKQSHADLVELEARLRSIVDLRDLVNVEG